MFQVRTILTGNSMEATNAMAFGNKFGMGYLPNSLEK